MEAWIGLFGVILGAIIAGVAGLVASSVQFNREKKWERKQLVRTKLEEAYQIVEEYRSAYIQVTGDLILTSKTGNNQVQFPNLPLSELTMLIYFYAPTLKSDIRQLYQFQDDYSKVMFVIVKGVQSESGDKLLQLLKEQHNRIENHLDKLLQQIVELAKYL